MKRLAIGWVAMILACTNSAMEDALNPVDDSFSAPGSGNTSSSVSGGPGATYSVSVSSP